MKKLIIVLLFTLFNHVFEGQGIFFNGWRHDQGNPVDTGPNLDPQGFGAEAAGADPGDPTYTVTNTNTSGAGSFDNALNTQLGGTGSANSHKKIVFSISGAGPHTIADDYTITNKSFITIDGAGEIIVFNPPNTCSGEPCGDAISLEGTGANHIIIKNLHFTDAQDGINIVDGAHDNVIMNCASWGNWDGNIDIANNANQNTVQYCVNGDHNGTTGNVGGSLNTGYNNSWHHNLWNVKSPDEGERCPMVHCNGNATCNAQNLNADIRYNIIYQYGRDEATGTGFGSQIVYGARANIINNYYYTPSTAADQDGVAIDGSPYSEPPGDAYSNGNVSGNGFNFNTGAYTSISEITVSSPYLPESETTCEAVENVLAHAGPDTKHSDVQAFIDEVTQLGSCAFQLQKPPILNWKDLGKGDKEGDKNENAGFAMSSLDAILPSNRKNKKQYI